ncbi:hypothetical protein O181_004067 [Austropuccinia psidii MF-1]|uniref:Integrase catalytic domain-containing protein n=1 Tax=Austropuccinia psidii MF-1 TaxID=1389203 RepID=A0A9Q3GFF6_9BASI|nr:hypothetical protein [Austropuccinia psidii MF-1]
MDTALLTWNRVVSCNGIFTNIISDRDPQLTSALWTNIQKLFVTKSSLNKAYHPQTDGLAESMIQNLGEIVKGFCEYGLKLKDWDEFTHDQCTLLPELKSAYKTSIYASTNKTTAIIQKGWNPRLPQDSLSNPTEAILKGTLERAGKHAARCMDD